jgi:Sec-independent protein secretion pathway component TatC
MGRRRRSERQGLFSTLVPAMTKRETKVRLGEFVNHLRDRLIVAMTGFIVAFVICFSFAELIIWLVPGSVAERLLQDPSRPFFSAEPIDHYSIRVRVAIFGAVCLSMLFLMAQEWAFRAQQKKVQARE